MKCLSCHKELSTDNTKIWNRVLVCSSCYDLAEATQRKIDALLSQAKEEAHNWLEQHILKGGLLGGTSDNAFRGAIGVFGSKEDKKPK